MASSTLVRRRAGDGDPEWPPPTKASAISGSLPGRVTAIQLRIENCENKLSRIHSFEREQPSSIVHNLNQ
uniref:Uncharacterized protein n=1 Tax=Oryza meridionalis TaxID=40149 RepID=A0A0E0ESF0_9ORYZ